MCLSNRSPFPQRIVCPWIRVTNLALLLLSPCKRKQESWGKNTALLVMYRNLVKYCIEIVLLLQSFTPAPIHSSYGMGPNKEFKPHKPSQVFQTDFESSTVQINICLTNGFLHRQARSCNRLSRQLYTNSQTY